MNARTLIVAALALVGAIVAFMLVKTFLSSAQQNAAQDVRPVEVTSQVLVTARPLPTGTIIKLEDMMWMKWPDTAIAETFIVEGRGKIEDQIGKVVRIAFGNKEPLNSTKVVSKGERGFVAAMLSPNMRAVSISVSVQTGVSGLALSGDRVDIILTHKVNDPYGFPHTVAETVFGNVRLLSLDQRTADNGAVGAPAKTVTIEVTPKMAEKVSMLQKLGTLSLSLRALPENTADIESGRYALPVDVTNTITWDNEVSQLLEPNKNKKIIVVRRGDATAAQNFEDKSKEKAQ